MFGREVQSQSFASTITIKSCLTFINKCANDGCTNVRIKFILIRRNNFSRIKSFYNLLYCSHISWNSHSHRSHICWSGIVLMVRGCRPTNDWKCTSCLDTCQQISEIAHSHISILKKRCIFCTI